MPDLLLRRALLSMAAFLLLSISVQGCATLHSASYTSPVPEEIRGEVRTVAVVLTVAATDNSAPRLDVHGPPQVNSLTPRFKWESFPRRMDVDDDILKILSRVSQVRYDLRIWKNENGGPGDVVYERTGLVLSATNGNAARV